MKAQLISILALLAPIMSSAQTQVTKEELAAFDDVEIVKSACLINDKTPGMRVIGEMATGLIGNFGETAKRYSTVSFGHHGIWEFLTDDVSNKIREGFITEAKKGCSSAKTQYLRYANLGIDADEATSNAFGDDDVRLEASHKPIPVKAAELYQKCSKLNGETEVEQANKVRWSVDGMSKRTLIFNDHAIADLIFHGMASMLNRNPVNSCAEIEGFERLAVERLIRADITLRKKIRNAGYDFQ